MIELLTRGRNGHMTEEDLAIFNSLRFILRHRSRQIDRADAEVMFSLVDTSAGLTRAPKKESEADRDNRLRDRSVRAGDGDRAVPVGSDAGGRERRGSELL